MSRPPVDALILKRKAWEALSRITKQQRSNHGSPITPTVPGATSFEYGQISSQTSIQGPRSSDANTDLSPNSFPTRKIARKTSTTLSIRTNCDTLMAGMRVHHKSKSGNGADYYLAWNQKIIHRGGTYHKTCGHHQYFFPEFLACHCRLDLREEFHEFIHIYNAIKTCEYKQYSKKNSRKQGCFLIYEKEILHLNHFRWRILH